LAERFLIVNADDFGMTDGINAGVVQAHRRGIVTSASLMVKQPKAREAAVLAAAEDRLGLGLHIDLTEWEPIDGVLQQMYARVDLDDPAQVAREIAEQLELFIKLVGREPDHLDSHQHVHLEGHVRSESIRLARSVGIPLRGIDSRVAFCGQFYGQQGRSDPYPEGITAANLLRLVDAMGDGWTELMCHPGLAQDVRSVYGFERESELATLCNPELPATLASHGVVLRSFAELGTAFTNN
jgi:chitin disaccharide deacetylase